MMAADRKPTEHETLANDAKLGLIAVGFNDNPRSYRCEFRAWIEEGDGRFQELRLNVEIPRQIEKHMDEIEADGLQKAQAVIDAIVTASFRSVGPALDRISPPPASE